MARPGHLETRHRRPGITNAGNIGWHQDYGYWQSSSTDDMCTAWVALQDTDLTNGGMRTIVGSHKWGLIEGSDGFGQRTWSRQPRVLPSCGGSQWLDEPCILKAGQASFHHCLTFHGSGPNRAQSRGCGGGAHDAGRHGLPRRTELHPNLVFLGPNAYDGQPFAGDYWPVMWPPG